MNRFPATLRAKAANYALIAGFSAVLAAGAAAQKPETRIVAAIDNSVRATLANSRIPKTLGATDEGRMNATTQLQSVSIYLSRSASQQTALETLLAAQQNPASPLYHQWLTPDQFAAQYGASDADISKVEDWLAQQGFTVAGAARNRSVITFTGSVSQIDSAFRTEMHYFDVRGEKHFAPATDLSIPAALAPAVLTVGNLSDLRPKSYVKKVTGKPNFTSSQSGSHLLTPKDLATIYDINAAYNSGWTGVGQTITIVGDSAVYASDISNFQTAAGVPVRAPNMILVTNPYTGASTIVAGEESESDIDLEYSSAIAKGATIDFVYTGVPANGVANYDAYDALGYAVTNKIGQIISISYGSCEAVFGSYFAQYDGYLQQAAAQGQSVIAAAGDDGSDACYSYAGTSNGVTVTAAQSTALSVSWPGSSAYATSMGGTEFPTADVSTTNTTYWINSTGTDVLSSATQYIPEIVWNDDSAAGGLSAGGGGISTESLHPSWQTGVTGIPASAYRLVPDISLNSSDTNAPYLYCSSDSTFTGITGSCSYGFRDAANEYLTEAGGTSFAAPIFAGMLAIINQSKGATTGQGLVNPTLYTLAANATTYASAFHDTTSGNNGCTAGVSYQYNNGTSNVYGAACPTTSAGSYAATTGYDLATGLGSIDLNNLLLAWPGTTASAPKSFTISAPALTITDGNTATETFTLTPVNGYTGTVNLTIATTPYMAAACYTITSGAITGTAAGTASATIYTPLASCPSGALSLAKSGTAQAAAQVPEKAGQQDAHELPARIAMAGLLAIGFLGRRSRRLRGIVTVAMLALVAGFGLSGCGSGAQTGTGIVGTTPTTTTTTIAPKGSYTMTVTGTDSASAISASTTFVVTIQ